MITPNNKLFYLTNFHWKYILWKWVQKQTSEVFCEKGVPRNFTKLTGKYLCESPFFNNVAGLTKWSNTLKQFISILLTNCLSVFDHFVRPATLLRKRLWHSSFPVNFVKFLRTPFFIEHLGRLLLWLVFTFKMHLLIWKIYCFIRSLFIQRLLVTTIHGLTKKKNGKNIQGSRYSL